jgi:hypothetical protein
MRFDPRCFSPPGGKLDQRAEFSREREPPFKHSQRFERFNTRTGTQTGPRAAKNDGQHPKP